MVGVPHHFDVIDLAERHVHRQLVGQRFGRVGRIGPRVERVHVPEQRPLGMRQIRHIAVRRIETGRGGVGIAGVLGQEIVVREPEQRGMAPIAGVKLLTVQQQQARAGRGVRVRPEIGDVGDALLLVHHKILDDMHVLGATLERQMLGRVAVGPTIVHVHVQIGAAPPAK